MFCAQIIIFYTVIIAICISGTPTCILNNLNSLDVLCSPGDDNYILKRGLIDNNQTMKITLRDCKISDIDNEAFHGLFNLRKIDLSHNKISVLKLGLLDDARKLNDLDLSFNIITQLSYGFFDKNTNLRVLNLKNNKIDNLEFGIFAPLSQLKHLDLSSNELSGFFLDPYIFDRNTQITYMDFSGNDMRETDDDLLHAFRALEVLVLQKCNLTDVPTFATRNNLRTMKTLVISNNHISKIDNKDTFINLDSLEELFIVQNVIKTIHEDVLRPLINLKYFSFAHNKLSHIPDTLFINMRNLETIDMSQNLITFVPFEVFRETGLKKLNLGGNLFTYLTANFCLGLRNLGVSLSHFYFDRNPWQCTCMLDILKEVIKDRIHYNDLYYDGEHPVCVSDDNYCKRNYSFNKIYEALYNKLVTNGEFKKTLDHYYYL